MQECERKADVRSRDTGNIGERGKCETDLKGIIPAMYGALS
jgi:hypothetical protein